MARATLHNLDEVRRKDIRIGDTVILQKAGDVIPEVVGPLLELRTGAEVEFEMPAVCPVCGTPVVRDEGAVRHYCPNLRCPARIAQEYGHFAGRGGMDIEGAGWAVVEQLLQRGLIGSRADFFRLDVETLMTLDRFARKSAENLVASIDRARRRPLARILNALGIPRWGSRPRSTWPAGWPAGSRRPTTSRWAAAAGWTARAATELTRIAEAEPEAFEAVPGVGSTVAAGLVRYFTDEGTRNVLAELVGAGVEAERPTVRPVAAEDGAAAGGPLAGKTLGRHRFAGRLRPAGRRGGDPGGRRPDLGLGLEEDRLPRGRRERRLEARQGPGARCARRRRGRLPAPAQRRAPDG